jgi:hypothetical protein
MRPHPAARMGAAAARQASQVPTTLTSRQARSVATSSHGALVGDVAAAAPHPLPGGGCQAGRGLLAAGLRPAGQDHVGAVRRQRAGDGQAEPG